MVISILFVLMVNHMKGHVKLRMFLLNICFMLHLLFISYETPLSLTNAAQAISTSVDYTFYVYFNTCNSLNCCYSFKGSRRLHFINAWMLSLAWRTSSIVNPQSTITTSPGSEWFKNPLLSIISLSLCILSKVYWNTHNVPMRYSADHVFCSVIWLIVVESLNSFI